MKIIAKIGFMTLMLLFIMLIMWNVVQLAIYFQVHLSESILTYLIVVLYLLFNDAYTYFFHDKNSEAKYFLFASPRRIVGVLFWVGLYAILIPL